MTSEHTFEFLDGPASGWNSTTAEADPWIWRCARRMAELRGDLELGQTHDLARELALDERLRARAPERVAEDMVRDDLWLA